MQVVDLRCEPEWCGSRSCSEPPGHLRNEWSESVTIACGSYSRQRCMHAPARGLSKRPSRLTTLHSPAAYPANPGIYSLLSGMLIFSHLGNLLPFSNGFPPDP